MDVDQLFQLPLSEFTAARNTLAKSAGRGGAAIKALSKPPLAAWAVNQLYWRDRDRYQSLIDAAKEMRRVHKAVIEGKGGDLRASGREHEAALDDALKGTIRILKDEGQPVTDATRQAILNTLRALPSEDAPGRLTKTLAPGGFEMLAGIMPRAGGGKPAPTKGGAAAVETAKPSAARGASKRDAKAERDAAKAREKRVALERAVREADQKARQAEFETARAAREAARAGKRLDEARRALDEAREAFDAAEKEAAAAARAQETAERRARDAQSALDAARAKLESA